MFEYPKIETLFHRDPDTRRVIPSRYRMSEFELVQYWMLTEKIDGTNIRVWMTSEGEVKIGGRTNNAQLPPHLLEHLQKTFTKDKMQSAFPVDGGRVGSPPMFPPVVLFGEGYGPEIQKGGGLYSDTPGFVLFDVHIGVWLNWDSVVEIASKLGVPTVPVLNIYDTVTSINFLKNFFRKSRFAKHEKEPEGIVARTNPVLCDRSGKRVMWKLKHSDFRGGKR